VAVAVGEGVQVAVGHRRPSSGGELQLAKASPVAARATRRRTARRLSRRQGAGGDLVTGYVRSGRRATAIMRSLSAWNSSRS
jgi:hypothetical protein